MGNNKMLEALPMTSPKVMPNLNNHRLLPSPPLCQLVSAYEL
jgi:hypothetical protein